MGNGNNNQVVFGILSPPEHPVVDEWWPGEFETWVSDPKICARMGSETRPGFFGVLVAAELHGVYRDYESREIQGPSRSYAMPLEEFFASLTAEDEHLRIRKEAWEGFRQAMVVKFNIDLGAGKLLWVRDWD